MTRTTPSESELRERLERGHDAPEASGGGYKAMDVMTAHHHSTVTSEKNLEDVEAFLHGCAREADRGPAGPLSLEGRSQDSNLDPVSMGDALYAIELLRRGVISVIRM